MMISISSARNRLSEIVEATEPTVILKNNKPVAVIMSADQYRALKSHSRLAVASPFDALELEKAYERAKQGKLRGKRLEGEPGIKRSKVSAETA